MRSFRFAMSGFLRTVREERHMRFHLVAALYVVAAGHAAAIEPWAWAALALCIGAVLAAECFNTALESACDEITEKLSAGIRRAKDAAAASVMLSAVTALAVGAAVFLRAQRLLALLAYFVENPVKTALFLLCLPVFLYFTFRR